MTRQLYVEVPAEGQNLLWQELVGGGAGRDVYMGNTEATVENRL